MNDQEDDAPPIETLCPNCGKALTYRKCKTICEHCGYFNDCSNQ